MRTRRTACLMSLLLAAGCDVYHPEALRRYDGGHDGGSRDAGADAGRDAGRDAGYDAGTDAGPACALRRPPERVPGHDGAGGPHVFALRNVTFDQADGVWMDIGYDLDGVCSVSEDTVTCTPRGDATPALDGEDGVDNAAGREILSALSSADPNVEHEAHANQDLGINAVLLVIDDWDGADDDAIVTAWMAQSLYGVPDGGVRGDPLAWDGTDAFYVSSLDYVDGDPSRPFIYDDAAYIERRRLVMRLPAGRPVTVPFRSDRQLEVRLSEAFLVAELGAGGMAIDRATITGRWSLIDLGPALTDVGLCPGTPERFAVDALIDRAADIRTDPTTDHLMLTCDAMSIALGFDGYRATFGGLVDPPTPVEACP